jgi:hypothetical protein
MSRENEDITKKVVDAVEEVEEEERNYNDEITLSSGVKIKVKPVNQFFIYQAVSKFKPPKVPRVFDEIKKREEENPNDPDYIIDQEHFLAEISNVSGDIMLLRGVEVLEVPKGLDDWNSKSWKDEMEIFGFETNKEKYRYLSWMKGVAITNSEEMNTVLKELGRVTGISETDAAEAAKRFRSAEGWQGDTESGNVD